MTDPRRRIPGVDTLLESPPFRSLIDRAPRDRVSGLLREVLAEVRASLDEAPGGDAGPSPPVDPAWYAEAVTRALERIEAPSLRRVVNATGVVLHTNLGRAPLPEAARRAILEAAGYTTVEYDTERGARGSRYDHCVPLLRELTGAEDALVVNNNAGAVVLALGGLARGREAVISRGELVEIGGSFRVPEIMARSGARMREIGSTNRTHLRDYQAAIGDDTGVVLKVHRSNFRVEGFTAEVPVRELSPVARSAGVPVVHDLGSGALLDLSRIGLPHEPTAGDALEAGADLVAMSGDKLLGGPQAGILVGRGDLMERLRRDPLCRALRPDKLTLAALSATLTLYLDPERALREVPVLRMLGATPESLAGRARDLAERLAAEGAEVEVVHSSAAVGGGAYPGVELPGPAVAIAVTPGAAERLARRLRSADPAVVGRIHDERLLLDVRTIDDAELDLVIAAVRAALATGDA